MNEEQNSISILIKTAKNYPLLKRGEEISLTTRFSLYSELLHFIVLIDTWKENFGEFLYFYKKRKQILDKLVCSNVRLVISCAKSFSNLGLSMEELINEGIDGLIHGICLFKPETGNKLSTYITWWINQAMGRALENKSRLVRLPNNKLGYISKIKRIVRNWLAKFNCRPTSEEIQAALENLPKPIILTVEEVKELGRLEMGYSSLDGPSGEDENLALITYLDAGVKWEPQEQVEAIADKEKIRNIIKRLPKSDRDYILLRFGFLDDQERTIKEAAQVFKLTIKEAKDKEVRILKKLSMFLSKEGFNYY